MISIELRGERRYSFRHSESRPKRLSEKHKVGLYMSFSGLGLSPKADFDPWVDGNTLIVPVEKSLPNWCVVCGQPAQKSFTRDFICYPSEMSSFLSGILGVLPAS